MLGKNVHAKNRPKYRFPVILMLFIIVASLLVPVALAEETEDTGGGDTSFYNMSSVGAGYLNDAFARGSIEGTITQGMAGGLLGYCDALDESGIISKWLHSAFSNSAISFSYDSFKSASGDVSSAGYSLLAYCKYGETLSLLGLDRTGAEGSHILRTVSGFLLEVAYTIAIFVPIMFSGICDILWTLNPFRFFSYDSPLADIDGLEYYVSASDGTSVSLWGGGEDRGLEFIAKMLTQVYDFMYENITIIILTISLGMLAMNLIFSNDRSGFKKIMGYVKKMCVMFLVVPMCAMLYTEGLHMLKQELALSTEYGLNRVILSTFVDFESWAKGLNLASPGSSQVKLSLDNRRNRPADSTLLNLRTTAFNINRAAWSAVGLSVDETSAEGVKFDYGVGPSTGNQAFRDYNTNIFSTARAGMSTNGVKAIYDLLHRYANGTFYYASSYESDFKKNYKYEDIKDIVEDTGTKVSTFKSKAKDHLISSDIIWGGGAGDLTTRDEGAREGVAWDFSSSAGLSPMAMYNYLSSTFDDSNVRVYSNEKSSSGFIRDNHFSVNLIGSSALESGLYWCNAFILLGSVSILGIFFAFGIVFSNFKRAFLMFPNIIGTTTGSLQQAARLVGHTILLIVETLVTALVYVICCEFLMNMNDIIEAPLLKGLGSMTSSDGAFAFSGIVIISLLLNSLVLIIFCIFAMRIRKQVVKVVDENVTRFVDRLFGVQSQPTPDTPSLGSRMAGGLATGLGAGAASKFLGGGDSDNSNVKGTAIADDAGNPPDGGDGGDDGGGGSLPPGGGSGGGGGVAAGDAAVEEHESEDVSDESGASELPPAGMDGEGESADARDAATADAVLEGGLGASVDGDSGVDGDAGSDVGSDTDSSSSSTAGAGIESVGGDDVGDTHDVASQDDAGGGADGDSDSDTPHDVEASQDTQDASKSNNNTGFGDTSGTREAKADQQRASQQTQGHDGNVDANRQSTDAAKQHTDKSGDTVQSDQSGHTGQNGDGSVPAQSKSKKLRPSEDKSATPTGGTGDHTKTGGSGGESGGTEGANTRTVRPGEDTVPNQTGGSNGTQSGQSGDSQTGGTGESSGTGGSGGESGGTEGANTRTVRPGEDTVPNQTGGSNGTQSGQSGDSQTGGTGESSGTGGSGGESGGTDGTNTRTISPDENTVPNQTGGSNGTQNGQSGGSGESNGTGGSGGESGGTPTKPIAGGHGSPDGTGGTGGSGEGSSKKTKGDKAGTTGAGRTGGPTSGTSGQSGDHSSDTGSEDTSSSTTRRGLESSGGGTKGGFDGGESVQDSTGGSDSVPAKGPSAGTPGEQSGQGGPNTTSQNRTPTPGSTTGTPGSSDGVRDARRGSQAGGQSSSVNGKPNAGQGSPTGGQDIRNARNGAPTGGPTGGGTPTGGTPSGIAPGGSGSNVGQVNNASCQNVPTGGSGQLVQGGSPSRTAQQPSSVGQTVEQQTGSRTSQGGQQSDRQSDGETRRQPNSRQQSGGQSQTQQSGPSMKRIIATSMIASVAQGSNNQIVQSFGNGISQASQAEMTSRIQNRNRGGEYVDHRQAEPETGSAEREDKSQQAENMVRRNRNKRPNQRPNQQSQQTSDTQRRDGDSRDVSSRTGDVRQDRRPAPRSNQKPNSETPPTDSGSGPLDDGDFF